MESKPPISDGKKNSQNAGEPEALGTILATIGDTTWRMFVPSVGFTLLGVWADVQLDTKPWLMVVKIVASASGWPAVWLFFLSSEIGGLLSITSNVTHCSL